jgi:hypothetical protein
MTIRTGDIIALGVLVAFIGYRMYRYNKAYNLAYMEIVKRNEENVEKNKTSKYKYEIVSNPEYRAKTIAKQKERFLAFFGFPMFSGIAGYLALSRGYEVIGWILVGITALYVSIIGSWFLMIMTLFGVFRRG